MNHAPIHLFDKGTWADPSGHRRTTVPLDGAAAKILEQSGWVLVDRWGVYLAPDRNSLVHVNDDGSLRKSRPYHPITEWGLK